MYAADFLKKLFFLSLADKENRLIKLCEGAKADFGQNYAKKASQGDSGFQVRATEERALHNWKKEAFHIAREGTRSSGGLGGSYLLK